MSMRKLMTITLGLAVAVMMSGAVAVMTDATPAEALTNDQMADILEAAGVDQAVIDAIIAAMDNADDSADDAEGLTAVTFTGNMGPGSEGANVKALQEWLNSNGYTVASSGPGSPGNETSYYGSLTQQAVGDFQDDQGVAYGAYRGYWGPASRAAAEAAFGTPSTGGDDDGDTDGDTDGDDDSDVSLEGGEGYLDMTDLSISSHAIDLGETEVVNEVDVEAIDSDVSVNRVDFMFDVRPWLYFDEVRLLMDGVEIATLSDSGDFSEVGSDWRARFSGLDEVISEGDSTEFALEVVVLNSMAGTRDTDPVDVWMPRNGIRGVDGADLVQYAPESAAFDKVTITFDDTFGEGDLALSIGDNSPETETYIVEENSRTDNQTVLEFSAKADSSSSINITSVKVNATTTNSDLTDMIYRARLVMDGSTIASVAPDSDGFDFTDLDKVISANSTADLEVEVDFRRTSTSGFNVTGETLTIDDVVVGFEDQDFASGTETLSVDETHDVVEEGLLAGQNPSINTTTQDDGKVGKYTFVFDVTALGDTYYVAEDDAFTASVSSSDGATSSTSTIVSSNATLSSGAYRINDGQTKQFTVEVFVSSASADDIFRVTLDDYVYGTSTSATSTLGPIDLGVERGYRSGGVFIQL